MDLMVHPALLRTTIPRALSNGSYATLLTTVLNGPAFYFRAPGAPGDPANDVTVSEIESGDDENPKEGSD